jgi:hypothetical protein
MKKLLPSLKNLLVKDGRSFTMVLMLLLLLGIDNRSQAQVYYMTNDATSGSTSSIDGINRMDYNGANTTLLANSFTNSPGLMEIDLPNNRAFVYEAFSASPPNGLSIKVVNLTTGAVTATIPITEATARCYAIKYDPINDYIYYVVADSSPTVATANDALIKVKPDGTGKTVVISAFSKNPTLLALDVANNKAYVYNQLAAEKNFLTINLSAGTVAQTITITAPAGNPFLVQDIDYDAETGYIYYLSSNNSGSTNANDAISKIRPNGTGYAAVVGVAQSPTFMALDLGNNRAFVFDNVAPARTISSIDLSTGTATVIKSLSSLPGSSTVTALWVPNLPVLNTTAATSVSSGTATAGGNITRSDVSVTERGVVYSSSNTTPTIGGSGVTKASNGSGTGSFSGSVSGLSPSTTYYLRSYATSVAGTAYGAVTTFTTLSNDATLSAFTLSAGTLTPSFSSGTISYTASVANANSTITVTPTRNQGNATITVNGTPVTSGSASGNISLNIGDNTITTIVTAQDGTTTKTYTLIVNRPKAVQTITFAGTATKTYGDGDYSPGASASSGLIVSYSSDNTNVATIVNGQIHIVAAGTANITASQAGDANTLAATSLVQALTVNKASQNITFNALPAKTYGDVDFALGATASSGLTVSYSSDNSAVATIVSNQVHIVGQGTANITASQAGDGNRLAATSVAQSFTVNKKIINVTANAQAKTYGDSDPAFTYSNDALAFSDGFTGSLARNPGEGFGAYAITQGNLTLNGNYTINFTGANLTINKKTINVTANVQTKTYGDSDPAFTYSNDALAFSDNFTGALTRAPGEGFGTYGISQGTLVLNSNYTINFTGANLTIGKKIINVTASAQTKTYGDSDPAFTYSNDVLAFSDSFTGALTRAPGEGFGIYGISQGTLALNSNYTINFTGANLTIDKKTINVTAVAASKTYGDADPAFTYNNDALAFSDNFTGSLTRDAGESFGTYAITQGSLALNSSYVINYTGANLSISKATLTYVATPVSRPFQSVNPTFTGTVTGFINGDSQTSATTGTLSFTSTATANSAIGSYPIIGGGLSAVNYNFIQAAANNTALTITQSNDATLAGLTVDQGTLTPAFVSETKTYSVTVPNNVTSIGVTPVATFGTATIQIGATQVNASNPTATVNLSEGSQTNIGVVVTAADGVTKQTYTISVTRMPFYSANVTLALSTGTTLVRTTGTSTYNYTASVSAEVSSVRLRAIAQENAVIKVNGNVVTSGVLSDPIALGVDPTVINVSVTAQDGVTVNTYSITVNHGGSNNANVSLVLNPAATLTSTTGASTYNYTTSVPSEVSSIRLKATALQANAVIKVNGNVVVSGVLSDPIALGTGPTVINVSVTAQDGVTVNTYSITVNHTISGNANVSLVLNPATTLISTTGTSTYNYKISVSADVSSISLKATAQQADAVIKVNGNVVASGVFSDPIALITDPTVINVSVTAQDGVTVNTYSITVNRTGSNNANVSLALTPAATLMSTTGTATYNYKTSVSGDVSSIRLKATAQQADAVIKINGNVVASGVFSDPIALITDPTVINVSVTAQDGVTVNTYSITVNRTGSNNANVSLTLTPVSTLMSTTGTATYNYKTSVSAGVSSVRLKTVAQQADAVIKVNGNVVASGALSDPIALIADPTVINISVTAQDGVTINTYSITVNRTGSSNVLANLVLNPATTLTAAATGPGNVNYTATVSEGQSTIRMIPTVYDNATVTVNGTTVTGGTASDPIALTAGSSTLITVVVTAENGTTVKTYTVNVARPSSFLMVDRNNSKLLFANKTANNVAPTGDDGVVVHPGVSPNGDGSNDFLYIEGISAYAGNKLSIMNTSGVLVFETKDYGKDGNHLFDGRSNKNGALLKPGTYFYALEYQVEKQSKRKTGYIIIKY